MKNPIKPVTPAHHKRLRICLDKLGYAHCPSPLEAEVYLKVGTEPFKSPINAFTDPKHRTTAVVTVVILGDSVSVIIVTTYAEKSVINGVVHQIPKVLKSVDVMFGLAQPHD